MIKALTELFSASSALRAFTGAACLILFAGGIGVHVISQALDQAANRAEMAERAAAPAQNRLVTRSVLDDNITTGSIIARANETKLDPCAAPGVKK